jgi:GT2 family glycosyltransferase
MRRSAYEDRNRIVVPTITPHGGSPFICCYLRREILDAVGKMDEDFHGYGYEDTDYYTRYEALGYYTHVIKEVVVSHPTPGMTWFRRQDTEDGIKVMDSCAANKRQFAKKWNRPDMDDGQ